MLIISFGGYAQKIGGIQQPEFLNFLNKHFPDTDKLFYMDSHCSNYHKGIKDISTDIPSTVEHLRTKIEGHSNVLFMGNSAGGYAAILFGSLLHVKNVLAFVPQTILYKDDKDPKYKDLKTLINPTTNYYVYGNLSVKTPKDPHHIGHCENITNFKNVIVTKLEKVDLKVLRDTGELFKIIYSILK